MKQNFYLKAWVVMVLLTAVPAVAGAQLGSLKHSIKKAVGEAMGGNTSQDRNSTRYRNETTSNAQRLLDQARSRHSSTEVEEASEAANESPAKEAAEEKVKLNLSDFGVDYSVGERTPWDYSSRAEDIMADYAYWLGRLKKSVLLGSPATLDYEAAVRVYTGKPDFEFFDIQYCLYDGVAQYTMERWHMEAKQLLKAFNQIEVQGLPESPDYSGDDKATKNRKLGNFMCEKAAAYIERARAATNPKTLEFNFNRAYTSLNTGIDMKWISGEEAALEGVSAALAQLYTQLDEDVKADYPSSFSIQDIKAFREKSKSSGGTGKDQQRFLMKKAALLKQYRHTEQQNDTAPMISGNVPWLSNAVADLCPEWGKVLASVVEKDYKVEVNALGIPVYRTHTGVVVCEDQGYRVKHYVYLMEDYEGGKYGATKIRPGGLKWNGQCLLIR